MSGVVLLANVQVRALGRGRTQFPAASSLDDEMLDGS